MPIKITDENYKTYKMLYEVFWLHYSQLLPFELNKDTSPIKVLDRFEARGKSFAKRSLQSGIGDLVFIARDIPKNIIQAIDKDLKDKNLPNFNSFRAIILDTRRKVLKSRRVRNLEEYYIIQELISDMSNDLTEEERHQLSSYLGKFENKSKHRE